MREVEDEELERIKKRKLEEMLGKASGRKKEAGPASRNSKPVDLTDNTFTGFIRVNSIVVVDMWAPWCGPCRFVSPIIEEMARDYAGMIAFGKLNVDQNPMVAMQYGVMSIPTLLVFKNGKLVDKIVGAMPRQRLEPRVASHL